MRIIERAVLAAVFVVGIGGSGAPRAAARQDQFLMPEQSAAKAKEILNQAIDALGGNAYLNVHDATCTGRLGQFDHSGSLNGFATFTDLEQPPSKERQENLPKRNIIQVYNGDKGWDLDRGGVADAPPSEIIDFQEGIQKDIDNILRRRIHEPGMEFRYGGSDIVDLNQSDWVELVDGDNRTIRIAFARSTHLPLRKIVETRDPNTRLKTVETEYYANFHIQDGIQTALQITRERNGIKLFQVFYEKCQYNTGLADSLFTKESLDERWAQVGKKEKDKKDKSGKDKD